MRRGEPPARAREVAAWIDRHRWAVLIVSAIVFAVGAALASRLPVRGDFANLLPPDAPSVRDLRALQARARVFGTVMIVLEGDAAARGRAADVLRHRLSELPPALVAHVTWDDAEARRFAWDNRFLFASIDDLRQARDALREQIRTANLKANPLYVDFEAEPQGEAAPDERVRRLRDKLDDAERSADAPGALVSKDGRTQLVLVRTPFAAAEVARGRTLVAELERAAEEARRAAPGVAIGLTGDVVTTMLEQRSILEGMVMATVLTVAIVGAALLLYYRTAVGVACLLWALAVSALATFGFTWATIGELNLATAFFSPIIVGNGINFGLILLARHLEERREGFHGVEAIARAMGGTAAGTLTAALTAAVSYGALVVTQFRGFRHFGVMGGVGILLCWIGAYTVLPAALAVYERRRRSPPRRAPALGPILARLIAQRTATTVAVGIALVAVGGVATVRYVASRPFEMDMKKLRSSNAAIAEARRWLAKADGAFGDNISGGLVIAAPDRAQARHAMERLRAVDAGKPPAERMFDRLTSLDDLLPADQDAKLAVLADIRDAVDRHRGELSDADRDDAARLRPPDDLRALTVDDVPDALAGPFVEKDGSRGRLIMVNVGAGYDEWNADALVAFAGAVRKLDLGPDVLLGGSLFVFADVLASVKQDLPLATLAALLGSILVVGSIFGLRRHGAVTLICCFAGTTLMVGIASLAGIKVHFLDFIALPITIGIGIDYSANIVARERQEGPGGARRAMATTGGTVALCSFTTIVGYASLLLSANQGIRSFGAAAIIGEGTCLGAALLLAPGLLLALAKRAGDHQRRIQSTSALPSPRLPKTASNRSPRKKYH